MLPRVTSGARPIALAALLYGLLALAFVSPALVPGKTLAGSDYLWDAIPWQAEKPDEVRGSGSNYELADASTQFLPFMRYARERLPDAPLWNPHQMIGRPFVGNAQSAVFSPLTTPAYVVPFWRSLALIAALKLFVAAFGTFLLARALGMRFVAAFLSGCAFAFGMFFVVWLAWPLSSVFAWIPWLLLATELVLRRPGPLSVAGLAGVVALQFVAGHPESSFHALAAAAVFLAWRAWRARVEDGAALLRPIAAWVGALLLGTALAGVAVVPFVEALANSADISERAGNDPQSVPAKYLLSTLLTDYWGRTTQAPRTGFTPDHAFYLGALPLFLALVALVLRPTAGRIATAGAAAVAAMIVTGTPGFVLDLVTELPGFAQAHNTRLTVIFLLALALLAGWGAHDLLGSPDRRRLRIALAVAGALALAPIVGVLSAKGIDGDLGRGLAVVWGLEDAPPIEAGDEHVETIRLVALLAWALFATAALALVAARGRGMLSARVFGGVAVALVVIDLFRAGMGWNPAIDVDVARQPDTGALRALRERGTERFAGIVPGFGDVPVTPNTAMDRDLYDARGYDFPIERRYSRFWKRYVAANAPYRPLTTLAAVHEPALRALSLLGVSSIVQDPADPQLRQPGLRLSYNRPDARVYSNRRALPRVWVASEQRVVGDSERALRAVGDPDWDPRRVAVLEEPVPNLEGGSGGDAWLVEYEPERVVVDVVSRGHGLLVLSDLFYPGWTARVDGREVDVERADYLLRGVPLPDGRHRVEFRYEPLSWRIGWILSLVALLALLALVALATAGVRARRRA
jgi:Bacterial membrane protein YfhO